jgi:hypothetical protein
MGGRNFPAALQQNISENPTLLWFIACKGKTKFVIF